MTTNSHPAHGPVSLDRLHQISEILSKASAQSDGGNLGHAMADAVKVIDGVIAVFDAEPVAWRYRYVHTPKTEEHGYPFTTEWKLCDSEDECNPSDCFERQPLYTAQPAPVVPEGLRLALSNAGIADPESDEMLAATHEKYTQMLVTWVRDRKPFRPAPVVNAIDETLIEALRLVQCMLDDYLERNYGHAQEWIRHISAKMEDYSEQHGDDAYSVISAAMLQSFGNSEQLNSPATSDGWQLVPKEPTAAMNKAGWDAMNEHDAINPTYRAMLASAPKQEMKAALEHGMQRYAGAMQKLSEGDD